MAIVQNQALSKRRASGLRVRSFRKFLDYSSRSKSIGSIASAGRAGMQAKMSPTKANQIRANADGERQQSSRGKTWLLVQLPERVPKILNQVVHRCSKDLIFQARFLLPEIALQTILKTL